MKYSFTVLLSFLTTSLPAQLTDARKFQLDSLVSVMPVSVRKDLWKAHGIIDSFAVNEEEKVWAFYGYIGVNFTYDFKRFKERNAPEYSPEITAVKGKAVCRDFAKLFSAMCARSNIRCLDIVGKADISLLEKVAGYSRRNFYPDLHAWNIVAFNNSWHLMDPTWAGVERTEKISIYSKKTKRYSSLRIKRCLRTYYDASPEFMAKSHAPFHPAFFMMDSIPTYKSAFRAHPRAYAAGYDFQSAIDSIFACEFPGLSRVLETGSVAYCGIGNLYRTYMYELALPLLKPTRYQSVTLRTYDEAEAHINRINAFLLEEHNLCYTLQYEYFKKKLAKKRAVLQRIADQKKK